MDIVTISKLKKYFGEGPRQVKALDGIDLTIEKGRFLSIVGASGSGKTTLLNTIGGLYEPTEGTVIVDGTDLSELTEEQLAVFQAAVADVIEEFKGVYGADACAAFGIN